MADKEEKKAKKAEKKAAKAEKKKGGDNTSLDEEDESVGSKIMVAGIGVLILLIWLVIFALLIKMDVGGFGSTVLYPVLKDVPVINKILPEVEDYAEEDEAYSYTNVEDAVKRIKELEVEIETLKNGGDSSAAHVAELEAQAKELEEYKASEKKYEDAKKKFYEEVVFSDKAPDINEYKEYYEAIEPDNAAEIYKRVVKQVEEDEEIEAYASAYASMKPAQAAAIFNTMTNDLKLVGKILWAMDSESRGKILGAMNSTTAAAVTKIMEP